MILKKILVLSFVIGLTACDNIELNTVDPQASANIESSKKNKLFISELKPIFLGGELFHIDQIWVERTWSYELNNFKKNILITGNFQIVMKVTDIKDSYYKKETFPFDWNIKDNKDNFWGSGNGVFWLHLIDVKIIPQKFDFSVIKLKNRDVVDSTKFQAILVDDK